jgi:hypothetical protein
MLQIYKSPRPAKRFMAIYNDRKYYFGSPSAFTYIDGASEKTKENYWKRHMANKTEKQRILNLIMSPSLLSAYVLWGDNRDIIDNIKDLEILLEGT